MEDERLALQHAIKVLTTAGRVGVNAQPFEHEFKREAQFLRILSHPHIIKMVRSKLAEDEERPKSNESKKSNRSNGSSDEAEKEVLSRYIVLEYAENGDLFDFTVAVGEAMGEEISRYYLHQLISAVEYLHVD